MSNAVEQIHQYRQFESYCTALEASLPQKLHIIEPWVQTWRGGDIVDIGAGTGALSAHQAQRCSESLVIGVDAAAAMVTLAQRRYGSNQNLEFRRGDASEVHSEEAACVIFCSVLHEVYSYSGDSLAAVKRAIQAAWHSLLPGGRLIIRDFVRPPDSDQPVLLYHQRSDIVPGHDFLSFSRSFLRPILVQSVCDNAHTMTYETDVRSACEYLLRKDYHEMWDVELHEYYGFWTATEARHLVRSTGFDIVHSEMVQNDWIVRMGLRGKIELRNPCTLRPLSLPPCQILLVAEKPRRSLCTLSV